VTVPYKIAGTMAIDTGGQLGPIILLPNMLLCVRMANTKEGAYS
jgi:hypothetical protein